MPPRTLRDLPSPVALVAAIAILAVVAALSRSAAAGSLGPLAVALPVIAWACSGRGSKRAAVAAGVVLMLGSTLVRPAPASVAWADLSLLALVTVAAALAGLRADRRLACGPP